MIRGVIFDMDGVLADTEYYYQQRREAYLSFMGLPMPKLDLVGSNEKAIWEAIVPEDALLREEMMLGYRAYRKLHPTDYKALADPQVGPLFAALKGKGLAIAIASSSDPGSIRTLMEAAGVRDLVDFFLSGESCTAHKPDPEIYLRALEALSLRPEEAIALEDSPTGIAAAKAAGIYTIALCPRHGEKLDQRGADRIIHTLMELGDLV